MKKLAIVVLLVVSACRRQAVVTSTPTQTPGTPAAAASTDGGANPRDALQRFFAAAKAQDIQAMSAIWGTKDGPARSGKTMPVEQMEQRLIFMARCLRHDTYTIRAETPVVGGERQLTAELRFGRAVASEDFTVTPGPAGRWFVRTFNVEKLNPICTAAS